MEINCKLVLKMIFLLHCQLNEDVITKKLSTMHLFA
jgi:hypothetical protein